MGDHYPNRGQYHNRPDSRTTPIPPPSRPLNDQELADLALRKQLCTEVMPEIVPFVHALYEAGMVEGWRCLASINRHIQKQTQNSASPLD